VDHVDFGRYLSQQRELRGMSREEISRSTKIPPSLVAALEEGQVERLPARIFVMNYIRAYAQVIGLAPEEAVLRFEEVDNATPAPPAEGQQRPEGRRRTWVGVAVVLLVLALGAYAFLVATGKLPRPFAG
jgi:cytoskeletal protein RodZ